MKSCPTCHSTYPSDFVLCPRDGMALVEVGVWSEGAVVRGKYRILGRLGQGGMAVVYKALHVRFDELRALKVMVPELASDQTFVKRFTHEAVITRKLQHPNAVRVEDIDEAEDGRPFIVMEYIEGSSLKDVIRTDAPMPVGRVCSIAKQVAAALHAAHRLGMVHRDIKPANIVLLGGTGVPPVLDHGQDGHATSGGAGVSPAAADRPITQSPDHSMAPSPDHPIAKVLDFGIAKIKEAHLEESRLRLTTLTGTGMVIGTPAYMSPEQAMGKRGEELDGRSDLYSLGVVMYQMLAGDLPLKADSEMQMLMAQINTRPPDIRTQRPDLPEAIASLVMRCLEKMPDGRPESGQALIEEIEYWQEEPARLARAQAEQERLAQERAEAKRAEREKADQERLAQERAEALARIKAEQERHAAERAEQQRLAREKVEAERLAAEKRDAERLARERDAKERVDAARQAAEKPEAERTPPKAPARLAYASPALRIAAAALFPLAIAAGIAWYAFRPKPERLLNNPELERPPVSNGEQPAQAPPGGQTPTSPPADAHPKLPSEASRVSVEKVKAAIALGDVHYNRAEYDDAITEYKKGLDADPSDRTLQIKLQRAQKAKEAEGRLDQ